MGGVMGSQGAGTVNLPRISERTRSDCYVIDRREEIIRLVVVEVAA